jgi:hypothetical protein
MKSGNQVIKELKTRGLRGEYFSYSQYSQLSKLNDFSEEKKLISSWGYNVEDAKNASELVDLLGAAKNMSKTEKGFLTAMIVEPLFWLFLLLFSGC